MIWGGGRVCGHDQGMFIRWRRSLNYHQIEIPHAPHDVVPAQRCGLPLPQHVGMVVMPPFLAQHPPAAHPGPPLLPASPLVGHPVLQELRRRHVHVSWSPFPTTTTPADTAPAATTTAAAATAPAAADAHACERLAVAPEPRPGFVGQNGLNSSDKPSTTRGYHVIHDCGG